MNIQIRRPEANDVDALNELFIATINDVFEREKKLMSQI